MGLLRIPAPPASGSARLTNKPVEIWLEGNDAEMEGNLFYIDPATGKETLSFKVWYPDDSTLRIEGRGNVDGTSASLDLLNRIRDIAIPM